MGGACRSHTCSNDILYPTDEGGIIAPVQTQGKLRRRFGLFVYVDFRGGCGFCHPCPWDHVQVRWEEGCAPGKRLAATASADRWSDSSLGRGEEMIRRRLSAPWCPSPLDSAVPLVERSSDWAGNVTSRLAAGGNTPNRGRNYPLRARHPNVGIATRSPGGID